MTLHTYLNFGGNCEAAFLFYEQHLGAKITFLKLWDERSEPAPPPGSVGKILHARLALAGTEILGSDVPDGRFQPMRSVYLTLGVDSNQEAERLHALLAEGGEIFMPMAETFFAHRFSMLRDRFGVSWMILHSRPQL